jgi:hypothetical protein
MENDNIDIKNLNFDSALKEIISLSDTFVFDVWVPSINEYVKFKEITASQQKDILSGSMDTSIYSKKFNNALFNILKTNSSIDVSNFTIIDKIIICLQLKEKISNILTLPSKTENVEKISVNLTDLILKIKNNYKHPEKSELIHNNIIATIYPSTILEEYEYDETIIKHNKKAEDLKNSDDIQNIISEAFIGELSKTIKNIGISDQNISLVDMTLKQRIQIVEKLPAKLIQDILNIVSVWKTNIDEILTIDQNFQIKIDPLFFIG